MYFRMFSSIPGLCPLDAGSTHSYDNQKYLQALLNVHLGALDLRDRIKCNVWTLLRSWIKQKKMFIKDILDDYKNLNVELNILNH